MYDQVKLLYEHQLWTNLTQLGAMVLTVDANTQTQHSSRNNAAAASASAAGDMKETPCSSTSTSTSLTSSLASPAGAGSLLTPGYVIPAYSCGWRDPYLIYCTYCRQRLNVMIMLGEALWECKESRRAEAVFKEALQMKKHLAKMKSSTKQAVSAIKIHFK